MTNDPLQPLFSPGFPPVDPLPEDPPVDPVYPANEPVTIPSSEPDDPVVVPVAPPAEGSIYRDEHVDPQTPAHRGGEELITHPAEEYAPGRAIGNPGTTANPADEYDQERAIGNPGTTPNPADEYDQPRASGNLGPHE